MLPLRAISAEEARVLGCLLEKEATTPDYYPLTLNSLLTACNQSTNREPVVSYDEATVQAALDGLKGRQLALQLTMAGARVQKYKHNLLGKLPDLERAEVAILCVLLLRGAQTLGELRQRTDRLYTFPDLAALEGTVMRLECYREGPLVVSLPPGPGRKATLYMHTLCGMPDVQVAEGGKGAAVVVPSTVTVLSLQEDQEWRAKVNAELAELRAELMRLKEALGV